MNSHPVQIDIAFFGVLSAGGSKCGLENHVNDGKAVDEEKEGIARHVAVER